MRTYVMVCIYTDETCDLTQDDIISLIRESVGGGVNFHEDTAEGLYYGFETAAENLNLIRMVTIGGEDGEE